MKHNISHNKKRKIYTNKKKYTIRSYPKISGKVISTNEGWKIIKLFGEPYERGFAHGCILFKEMIKITVSFPVIVENHLKVPFDKYLQTCKKVISPIVRSNHPEFYEEIRGIAEGFAYKGVKYSINGNSTSIDIDYIIAWNSLLSMYSYFNKKDAYRCCAFIATGNATVDGQIVMAHNVHADFVIGQTQNIIIYMFPSNGKPFVMQTAPGYIASGADWFLCSSGIIGCETTITGIDYRPEFGSPFYCRIREAMQYGTSLDDYTSIMLKYNAGDYACSWFLGNIHTNEIMLFEIGLHTHNIEKTQNGVFYGMNSAVGFELRNTETIDRDLYNTEKSTGARNFRLNQLLNDTYFGKINITNAKRILSDHYDVHLHKNTMNSRCICKHSELDDSHNNRNPFYPFGCTDGKVVNTQMARKMKFFGRFGSACGRNFRAKEHIKKHPEYSKWKNVLEDLPTKKWTIISSLEN